jgi:hypothetical protein
MTRDEILVKLLSVEPEDERSIVRQTGWDRQETIDLLLRLVADGVLTYTNWTNQHNRMYYLRRARK